MPIESWTDPSNWSLLIYLSRFIFHSSLRFPSNKRKPMQTFIIDQFDSENWTQGNEKERSDLSRGCIDIVTRNTPHSRRRRIAHRCTRHCYGERIVTPYIHIVFSNENLVGFVEACLLFFFSNLSPFAASKSVFALFRVPYFRIIRIPFRKISPSSAVFWYNCVNRKWKRESYPCSREIRWEILGKSSENCLYFRLMENIQRSSNV